MLEEVIKIQVEGFEMDVMCEVIEDNWPYGLLIRPIMINGIDASKFKSEFIKEIAGKCHEQLSNDRADRRQESLDSYDEGDR